MKNPDRQKAGQWITTQVSRVDLWNAISSLFNGTSQDARCGSDSYCAMWYGKTPYHLLQLDSIYIYAFMGHPICRIAGRLNYSVTPRARPFRLRLKATQRHVHPGTR